MTTQEYDLEKEIKKNKELIKKLERESSVLKKAIWDMLNYCNMFVVLLDKNMNITLANWSLAQKLGFETEKDLIGRCWLDFIKDSDKENIKYIHKTLSSNPKSKKYPEVISDIKSKTGEITTVKWFNISINSGYNIIFSAGIELKQSIDDLVNEDSVRAYYRDIINKDRTMIESLKDLVIKGNDTTSDNMCKIIDEDNE